MVSVFSDSVQICDIGALNGRCLNVACNKEESTKPQPDVCSFLSIRGETGRKSVEAFRVFH